MNKDIFSYGLELEIGDIDRSIDIPEELGSWEGDKLPNGYYAGAECDIINQIPPYYGISTDPLAETCPVGGEINVYPTTNIAGQFVKANQIYELFKNKSISQQSHYHLHVGVKGIKEDINLLKNVIKYCIKNQKDLINFVYYNNLYIPYGVDESYYINDGGRLLDESLLEKIEKTDSIDEILRMLDTQTFFQNGQKSTSKRAAINLSNLSKNETIEFRCFRTTLFDYHLASQLILIEKFMKEAIINSDVTVLDILSKGHYKFAELKVDSTLHHAAEQTRHPKERSEGIKYSKTQYKEPVYVEADERWFYAVKRIFPLKRFAFTGTHSTGKTTIIDELKKNNDNFDYRYSITRKISKKDNKLNTNCDSVSQKKLIQETLKYYEDLTISDKDVISDRCFIDSYAYTMYFYEQGLISEEVLDYGRKQFEKTLQNHDWIFYFKNEIEMEQDGDRIDDEEYRYKIEENIEKILKDYNIPHTIIQGTVEERVKQVESIICT